MPTLTSTGAVNLTSSTNWSPAQIPQAGDDLILNGAHNLTLDADMVLNSITFAHGSARLVMPGSTTRVVQATNGFIVTASITIAVSTTLVAGMDLTLRGAWSATTNNSISAIAASTGGNLTLEPAGGGTSGVLFADTTSGGGRGICSTWSGGTLTTRGLLNFVTATSGLGTLVTMTGGTWNHTHTGSLTWSGNSGVAIAGLNGGTGNVNWNGQLNVASNNTTGLFQLTSSGTHSITGPVKRTSSNAGSNVNGSTTSPLVAFGGAGSTLNVTGLLCSTKIARAPALITNGTAGSRVNWRSQSLSIPSTDAVIIVHGAAAVIDLTSLIVDNAGVFTYVELGSATAVVDGTTSITNTTTSAQASVTSASGALDGKIVTLASSPPTLPTVAQVAAGTSYGYSGTPLTGTGLIVDPATLATAMITSFSSLPEVMVRTTIATLASQTSFTLTAGSADDDVYNGLTAVITDQSTSVQKAVATISDYVGSTKTVTLSVAPGFTIATGDSISVIAGSSSGGGGGSFPSEAPPNWIKAVGIQDGAFTAAKFAASALNDKGNWAKAGDAMALTSTILTQLFADADVTDLVNQIAAKFDGVDDLPIQTIANASRDAILNRVLAGNHDTAGTVGKLLQFLDALISSRLASASYTAPDNSGIASAKTAAESADGKLTTGRLSRVDRLPDANAGASGGLSLVGSEMSLTSTILTQLFADADVTDLVNQIAAKFDGVDDLPIQTIANAARDAILNRVLAGNHDTAGTVGKLLQFLDALISSRLAGGSYTAPDNSTIGTISALLAAMTEVVSAVTRFKASALSQAPGSSGALTTEQAEQLDRIEAASASITGARVLRSVGPVSPAGEITLIVGSDYVEDVSGSLTVTVTDPGAILHAKLTAGELSELVFLASPKANAATASKVAGTITDVSEAEGITSITIEIPRASIPDGPYSDDYKYQIWRVVGELVSPPLVQGKLILDWRA